MRLGRFVLTATMAGVTGTTSVPTTQQLSGLRVGDITPTTNAVYARRTQKSGRTQKDGIDAYGGRVVATFPALTANSQQKVQAAMAIFVPGTMSLQ